MYNVILSIFLLFVPFLFLFFMGIEIYVNKPRNQINLLVMLMMFIYAVLFLSEFWIDTLPLNKFLYVTLGIKYISTLLIMTLALYLSCNITKIQIKQVFKHLLCIVPVLGILPVFHTYIVAMTRHSSGNLILDLQKFDHLMQNVMSLNTVYTCLLVFIFVWLGNHQNRNQKWLKKDHLYMQRIKLGITLFLVWGLSTHLIIGESAFRTNILYGTTPYNIIPFYGSLIFAYFCRKAMIQENFLNSPYHRFEILFFSSKNGILLMNDEGVVLEANKALRKMLGIDPNVADKDIDFFQVLEPAQKQKVNELLENNGQAPQSYIDLTIVNLNNETLRVELYPSSYEMDNHTFYYLLLHDITEKKNTESKLKKLAYKDNLTNLGNRRYFVENLQKIINSSISEDQLSAIFLIDLDQFKWINDTLGHSTGDFLLQHAATLIKENMPSSAVLSRFSGDEFAVAMPIRDKEEATYYAEKLLSSLQEPVSIFDKLYTITASIGISIAPTDGHTVELLMSNSDTAMYAAKRAGRNQYHLYSPNLKAMAERHLLLLNGLNTALERNEFVLYYQPQFDIHTNQLVGLEALIRWNSPELGFVPPDQFIPLAEETGVINVIGDWVLSEAIKQTKRLVSQGYPDINVAINISAHQLRDPFIAERIEQLLCQNNLSPKNICLEITETTAIFDMKKSLETCKMLVDKGATMSIDDFGTGYSSLSMLNRFPFHFIKIDRSLIKDMTINSKETAIIQSIIELSQLLKMKCIAEGVETEEQLNMLKKLGCHQVQGYLTGRPMPFDELVTFLKERKV